MKAAGHAWEPQGGRWTGAGAGNNAEVSEQEVK